MKHLTNFAHRTEVERDLARACVASPQQAIAILDREGVEGRHFESYDSAVMVGATYVYPDDADYDKRQQLIRLALLKAGMWSDTDDSPHPLPWNHRALLIFSILAPHGRDEIETGCTLASRELRRIDAIEAELATIGQRTRDLLAGRVEPAGIALKPAGLVTSRRKVGN